MESIVDGGKERRGVLQKNQICVVSVHEMKQKKKKNS